MKVIIDQDLCQSHGVCTAEAPEVFELNDEGVLVVLQESLDESQRAAVESAVKYCPTNAISIAEG